MNSINQFPTSADAANASIATTQARLEQLLKSSPSLPQPNAHTPWYQRLGQWLLTSLTDTQQVRIWTKITPNGTQWSAYDPNSQRRFSCYSEAELRAWLEQRHYS